MFWWTKGESKPDPSPFASGQPVSSDGLQLRRDSNPRPDPSREPLYPTELRYLRSYSDACDRPCHDPLDSHFDNDADKITVSRLVSRMEPRNPFQDRFPPSTLIGFRPALHAVLFAEHDFAPDSLLRILNEGSGRKQPAPLRRNVVIKCRRPREAGVFFCCRFPNEPEHEFRLPPLDCAGGPEHHALTGHVNDGKIVVGRSHFGHADVVTDHRAHSRIGRDRVSREDRR